MMKILYAPLTLVWAILMVSCSSDDDLIERITPAQWSREVTDSDVKIQLSTGSKTTKASITSDEKGLFNAKGMSVFCLATDYKIHQLSQSIGIKVVMALNTLYG